MTKLIDAVSEAHSELAQLGEEMREAFDNTPEGLQGSDVGQAREAAADELENLDEPDVPKSAAELEVWWKKPERTMSQQKRMTRAQRRDDALQILAEVMSALDTRIEEIELAQAAIIKEGGEPNLDELDALKNFREEIENLHDNADNVYFPGMRG